MFYRRLKLATLKNSGVSAYSSRCCLSYLTYQDRLFWVLSTNSESCCCKSNCADSIRLLKKMRWNDFRATRRDGAIPRINPCRRVLSTACLPAAQKCLPPNLTQCHLIKPRSHILDWANLVNDSALFVHFEPNIWLFRPWPKMCKISPACLKIPALASAARQLGQPMHS